MSKQLDVSPEARQIIEEKVQRKQFLRNEFLKLKTDPFKHATGEAGTVFDSGFLRYQAMQANAYDYFKPSGRNILYGIGFLVVPMFLFGFLMNNSRAKREASFRRGEVAYRNRMYKFQ